MCARYVSKATADWERWFSIRRTPEFASWNIAPSHLVPVVIATDEGNQAELMRFGLVPYFSRGRLPKFATINARVENLRNNASWRGPWERGQRCIVPANGFYEWRVQANGTKQAFYIHLSDRAVFGFAGLWDRSMKPDGTLIQSFAIITLPAAGLLAQIHNAKLREPAILAAEDHAGWLSGTPLEAGAALKPYPDEQLEAWPVGWRVNSPDNNDAALIERAVSPIALDLFEK
jgi:putative SOS response-associated peptidase YedK